MPKRVRFVEDIVWSFSRYRMVSTCHRQDYYNYVRRVLKTPNTPETLAGSILHDKIENFYHTKGKKKGQPKHKNAEEFAEAARGTWAYEVQMAEKGFLKKKPIAWRSLQKTNQYERTTGEVLQELNDWAGVEEEVEDETTKRRIKGEFFRWRSVIYALAKKIYANYSQQSPPMYAEDKTNVIMVKGVRMFGIIDAFYKPMTIRDHKSRALEITPDALARDAQFTMYAGILSYLCSRDMNTAVKMGVPKEDFPKLWQDPLYLIDKFKCEHHFLHTGKVEKGEERQVKIIDAPPRKKEDFITIVENMKKYQETARKGHFEPTYGTHCQWCFFKTKCDSDNENGIETKIAEQLDLVKPEIKEWDRFEKRPEKIKVRARRTGQQKFAFMKEETIKTPEETPNTGDANAIRS